MRCGDIVWEKEEEDIEGEEEEKKMLHHLPVDWVGFRVFHRRVYQGTQSPSFFSFSLLFPSLTPQSSTLTLG